MTKVSMKFLKSTNICKKKMVNIPQNALLAHPLKLNSNYYQLSTSPPAKPCQLVLKDLICKFEEYNISEPKESAEYLISHIVGRYKTWDSIPNKDSTFLTQDQIDNHLEPLVQARLANMPLQYILKNWDFRDLELELKPPVFIPRPETEKLVDLVSNEVLSSKTASSILEIGTGSGAICLSLVKELNQSLISHLLSVDSSELAVQLANENAKKLGFLESSFLSIVKNKLLNEGSFENEIDLSFDIIVSNPPYVLRKDLQLLSPDIKLYEDLRALDGGPQGLDVVKSILKFASGKQVLKDLDSKIFLELDPCQPTILLPKLLDEENFPFQILEIVKDFRCKDRFVILGFK